MDLLFGCVKKTKCSCVCSVAKDEFDGVPQVQASSGVEKEVRVTEEVYDEEPHAVEISEETYI